MAKHGLKYKNLIVFALNFEVFLAILFDDIRSQDFRRTVAKARSSFLPPKLLTSIEKCLNKTIFEKVGMQGQFLTKYQGYCFFHLHFRKQSVILSESEVDFFHYLDVN